MRFSARLSRCQEEGQGALDGRCAVRAVLRSRGGAENIFPHLLPDALALNPKSGQGSESAQQSPDSSHQFLAHGPTGSESPARARGTP